MQECGILVNGKKANPYAQLKHEFKLLFNVHILQVKWHVGVIAEILKHN